jgi:hypothetical protein
MVRAEGQQQDDGDRHAQDQQQERSHCKGRPMLTIAA